MSSQDEYIVQLMSEKLARVISPEDEQLLDTLIANEAVMQQRWEQYKARFNPNDVSNNFEKAGRIAWKPVRKSVRRLPYYMVAAAVAGIAALAIWWPSRSKETLSANGIHLTLANGNKVELSASKSSIQLNGAHLNNSGTSLNYIAEGNIPEGLNELAVPVGKDYKITLEDGSVVWLNAASRLKFPFRFTGNTRHIKISGEAFIEVAPDARRPFIVETDIGRVRVLGTSFNLNNYDSGHIVLSLVTGAAELVAGNNALLLKPGMQVQYSEAGGMEKKAFDAAKVLCWQKGVFYFEASPLADICKVLPRWYGTKVVTDNPLVAGQRFTGRLMRDMPLEAFLEQLKSTTSVDYYFDDQQVLHFK